jgi:hypothetical protein
MIRTGNAFGANDSIWRYQGTNQQGAAFLEQLSENNASYYLPNAGLAVPVTQIAWSVTDLNGKATNLATINANGLLAATGVDDGKVKVKAVLKNNPDITAERVITLQGQGVKNGSRWIQAENFDTGTFFTGNGSAFAAGGSEMGLYSTATISGTNSPTALYKKVDLGHAANGFYIRTASTSDANLQVWIDAPNAAGGGTMLTTMALPSTASNNNYVTHSVAFDEEYSGVHDVYLVFPAIAGGSRAVRVNWFQFSTKFLAQFDTAGGAGAAPASQVIMPGGTVVEPPAPTKGDAEFLGWYPTSDLSATPWDFSSDTVERSTTFTAKWKGTQLKANTTVRVSLRLSRDKVNGYSVAPVSDGNAYLYSSSNPAIARVDKDGKVTPVRAGTATISVRLDDGSGLVSSFIVTVTP